VKRMRTAERIGRRIGQKQNPRPVVAKASNNEQSDIWSNFDDRLDVARNGRNGTWTTKR
jgi:hypothetical protein